MFSAILNERGRGADWPLGVLNTFPRGEEMPTCANKLLFYSKRLEWEERIADI